MTTKTTSTTKSTKSSVSKKTWGKTGSVTMEDISKRAYEIYLERGSNGNELEDWLRAERELRSK
ncbi:MAG: DUF2934 domain-containing protein [Bacteroidia bacterium]|nr:DUF2934 domain-containing protein [Bacteroidia bacterium]